MTARKRDIAALPGWPRILSKELAAAYMGYSVNTFMGMVAEGIYPQPMQHKLRGKVLRRLVWDRLDLDRAVDGGKDKSFLTSQQAGEEILLERLDQRKRGKAIT